MQQPCSVAKLKTPKRSSLPFATYGIAQNVVTEHVVYDEINIRTDYADLGRRKYGKTSLTM